MSKRYVLLDRDGTLIVEKGYLYRPEEVELTPGAGVALARVQELGWGIGVITNQSGIDRGYYGWRDVEAVHARLAALLAQHGVRLGGIYVCPHRPDAGCACRKPRPGLVQQAAAELQFDPAKAVVVGDKACDLEVGRDVAAVTCLVRTGYGRQCEQTHAAQADYVLDDLSTLPALIQRLPALT